MSLTRIATTTVLLALGLGTAAAACFSDRGTTGPDPEFECDVPIPSDIAGNTIVFIRDYDFIPRQVTVAPGTRVSWVNCGPADSHTATSDTDVWDSGLLAPAATYTRTFTQAGAFAYHCEPHPSMVGTITVE